MGGESFSSLFINHGAPALPLGTSVARRFLEDLGRRIPRPRAIVVVCPQWQAPHFQIRAPRRFQARASSKAAGAGDGLLSELRYEPRGDTDLATRAQSMLGSAGLAVEVLEDDRLDAGAWVPLMLMYPQADIPLIQISLAQGGPAALYAAGRALRPLTLNEVLLVGAGGFVEHRVAPQEEDAATIEWAMVFEDWVEEHLLSGDWPTLLNWRKLAPMPEAAPANDQHLLPLFFAGGAGGETRRLHRSFVHGSVSQATYGFL